MITLYSGIPGSGKSYLMVENLSKVKDEFFVVHNIDGLKEGYLGEYGLQFEVYCKDKNMEVIDFFSKDFQVDLAEQVKTKHDRNMLVIVDEAHEWFDRNKKQLKMWLSYHRHLNQTIWLVAHRSSNLPSVYRSFIEIEYRAKHGSILNIPGYFMYNRICGGERIGYSMKRIKPEIFKLYKSQKQGFVKKKGSLFLPVIALLCIAGVAYFFIMPQKIIGKNIDSAKIKKEGGAPGSALPTPGVNEAKFRYAGKAGGKILIEDISSGRVLPVAQLSGFVLMSVGIDSVTIFDVENKKNIIVKSYNAGSAQSRSISENGLLPIPAKSFSGK